MNLAYLDESGDTGPRSSGGSKTFALGCVVLPADRWVAAFDEVIRWRRSLSHRFHLPMRAEIKANYLTGSRGPFEKLNLRPDQREDIFREGLELLGSLDARVFAIVIDKSNAAFRSDLDPLERAWTFALQRLEKLTSAEQPVLVVHDDGERTRVRAIARKARRAASAGSAYGGGSIWAPLVGLLDDPVSRNSAESYFIQLVDLVAYAAYRVVVPPPPHQKVGRSSLWNALGSSIYAEAATLKPGPAPGIVLWPK